MTRGMRLFFALILGICAAAVGAHGWFGQPERDSWPFSPAYFQPNNPPRLRLFPPNGAEKDVALPDSLPANLRGIVFGSDGKTLYLQKAEPLNRSAGIYQMGFEPVRESLIPGSMGMGEVWCLAVSQPTGMIVVAGWSWTAMKGGVFEIDPNTATRRPLPIDAASGCGGDGGVLSPDGKRAIIKDGSQLALRALNKGTTSKIKGTNMDMQTAWSPDGRWIAAVGKGSITLIDGDDLEHSRGLGGSGDGGFVWSPDSKHLLLRTKSASCTLSLYGESLEVVDVETGKRDFVRSSHCTITAGTLGWVGRSVVQ